MKIGFGNWLAYVTLFSAWRELPRAAQELFLLFDSRKPDTLPKGDAGPLLQGGWIERTSQDGFQLLPARAPLHQLMTGLSAVNVFEESTPPLAVTSAYLKRHFEPFEQYALGGSGYYSDSEAQAIFKKVGSQAWIDGFLNGQAPRWEAHEGSTVQHRYFSSPNIMGRAQRLLKRVKSSLSPLRVAELFEPADSEKWETFAKALTGLMRYLLLFAALDPETLETRVGLFPELAARLHRPPAADPVPVEPSETWHHPYLAEDLAALLRATQVTPLRLKGTAEELFARDAKEVTELLTPLPGWLEGSEFTDEARLRGVLSLALALNYARNTATGGDATRLLHLTSAGEQWLAQTPTERLRKVLTVFRHGPDGTMRKAARALATLPAHPSWSLEKSNERVNPESGVLRAWSKAEAGHFVVFADFLDYATRKWNPLPSDFRLGDALCEFRVSSGRMGYEPMSPEEIEQRGRELLCDFFRQRLVPLGAVTLGRAGADRLLFRLHDIGRFLLGEKVDFILAAERVGEIVIQPNFEIVFLESNPSAENALRRFCERAGRQHGVLFRITRQSCLLSARDGLSCDEALQTLRRLSAKPVPLNVEEEMRAWFSATRKVRMRDTLLLECAEAETARQIVSLFKTKARLLNETTVEFPAGELSCSQKARLEKQGIFVEQK